MTPPSTSRSSGGVLDLLKTAGFGPQKGEKYMETKKIDGWSMMSMVR